MRFSATSKFNALARGASKLLQWRVYIKKTNVLTEALSAGTWTEVTNRIKDIPGIESSIEVGLAQFNANSITLTGKGISYWHSTFWVSGNIFLELKIECQIGLSESDLAADIVYAFSGLIKRAPGSIRENESADEVTFTVNSYDEYGRERSAEDIVTQPVNTDIDGAGKDGLILQNIPGVFASNANIASFVLKKGIHTVTWEYNGGTERMKLDDGSYVTLPTSNGTATLVNAAGDQKLEVYVIVADQLTSGTVTQDIIVTTEGNTIPNVWLQRQWAFAMLKQLYAKIGLTSYAFDANFILSTWDARNITSYFGVPPEDSYYGKPGCVKYDATNNVLWVGVSDKLYKRNMSTHEYTDLGVLSSGYIINRIFSEHIASDKLWVLAKNSSHTYKLFRVTISTSAVSGYTLTNRGTGDSSGTMGVQNFAFAPSAGTSGRIFYCKTDGSDTVWYFDLNSLAEVDTTVVFDTTTALQYTSVAWSDGADYWLQRYGGSAGTVKIVRVFDMGGYLGSTQNGGVATNQFEDGAYVSADGKFYYTLVGGNGVYSYNHGADSITTIDASGSAADFDKPAALDRAYFKRGTGAAPTFSYVAGGAITNISGTASVPYTGDSISAPNKITWDSTTSRILGVFERSYMLFQFYSKSAMYVDVEADWTGKTIGDAARELAVAFNLMVFISSVKKAYAYRRGDDSGTPVSSGNTLSITVSEPDAIEREKVAEQKFDIVQVTNGTTTYNYDGTTMRSGERASFAAERILTIDNRLIPSAIVQDIAYYAYQYFKKDRDAYTFPLGKVPLFQYEPFDGLSITFTSTQIAKTGTGIITGQTLHKDGSMTVKTLIAWV